MSKSITSRRCMLCGGMTNRDYEIATPKGRFVKSLCTECRDAVQAKGWPLRAYPPRRISDEWLTSVRLRPVNAVAGPATATPRGVSR